MQGAAIGTVLAQDADTLYIDNKGVTTCAVVASTRKCVNMDLRHIVHDNLRIKTVVQESKARNAQEREGILRTAEVDLLATMATHLPVPDYDPTNPRGTAMNGGPTPTPARKWTVQCRRVSRFQGTQQTSWLHVRGVRWILWVKWLL